MALRTWIIRGLILAVLAGVGYGLWWAQSYVSPEAIRASLLATLNEQFPEAEVTVGSAHIRVFGGISIRDLTLTRRGEDRPLFTAPSGTIYHDKEQISRGRLAIRKVELDSPTLSVERRPDGSWSLEGLSDSGAMSAAVPTFVIQKATLNFVDRSPSKWPSFQLTDANLTLVNDPAPHYLVLKGTATATLDDGYSTRFTLIGRLNRGTGQLSLRTELPDLTLGPSLVPFVAAVEPDAIDYLKSISGPVAVRSELTYTPGQPFQYDVGLTLKGIRFEDKLLPAPAEEVRGSIRVRNGSTVVDRLTAKLGTATVNLSLETRAAPAAPAAPPVGGSTTPGVLVSRTPAPQPAAGNSPFQKIEDRLERIDVSLGDLAVDDDLFERLPAELRKLRTKYSPSGTVAIGYRFSRPSAETWKREIELKPTKLAILYERFRYPYTDVTGSIRQTVTPEGEEARVELAGTAGGQRVDVKGTVRGTGPDPAIAIKISGTNLPIDEPLMNALPARRHADLLRSLRATGRGDFTVDIKQEAGQNLLENVIKLEVYDVALNYRAFPYPLEKVRGKVNIYVSANDPTRPIRPGDPLGPLPDTDRIEIRDVTARHGTGTIWIKGNNDPIPGSRDRKLSLSVWGKDCPIDDPFREALAAIKLGVVGEVLRPEGNLTFAVDADVIDRIERPKSDRARGPMAARSDDPYGRLMALAKSSGESTFDPATDLKLAFNFEGPTVTPEFFPYRMDELAGRLKYDGTRVKLEKLVARHGASKLALDAAEVRFYDDGRIWANLGQLDVAPLVMDDKLVAALPRGLRGGARDLNLRGPAEMTLKHMVLLTPANDATSTLDPEVFWKGELRLAGAAFEAGVACDNAHGKLACSGSYLPTHLGKVQGNLWLDSASIASHPAASVKATFDADPQEPDPVRPGELLPPAFKFTDIQGNFFSGTIGGTGRVVLSDPTRYRLSLTATDIRLEDIARHHNLGQGVKMEGAAQASILLETIADPITGKPVLSGYGKADVDRGQIYNLPPLVPLLKALKLQAPDKTAFEEAHAVFTIRGDRVRVDHVDLLGSAISLGGAGELDMAGKYVKFDFYTIWSQTLQRWLTTPFGDLTAMVSEKLFKIEVTRKPDGEMKYEPRPVPIVTDPFKAVAERIKARAAKLPTARANAGN